MGGAAQEKKNCDEIPPMDEYPHLMNLVSCLVHPHYSLVPGLTQPDFRKPPVNVQTDWRSIYLSTLPIWRLSLFDLKQAATA